MKRRLGLVYLGVLVIALLLIVRFNMVLFGGSLGKALANPYMWMEIVILAGTLIYLYK
ncbi:MAG TPA: hypothetical protein VK988_00975 [Acidimicrobiales bacterium]|nr:hypothetical protein [Acidimicrobiales bacterium]